MFLKLSKSWACLGAASLFSRKFQSPVSASMSLPLIVSSMFKMLVSLLLSVLVWQWENASNNSFYQSSGGCVFTSLSKKMFLKVFYTGWMERYVLRLCLLGWTTASFASLFMFISWHAIPCHSVAERRTLKQPFCRWCNMLDGIKSRGAHRICKKGTHSGLENDVTGTC